MITRARTLLTGLTALVILMAAVIGLPAVLYRFGGSPLPRHLASWHHVTSVLTSRDNGTVLLGVIRDLSWLAWLLFTVAVLAEAQAAIRGRRAPRLWLGALQGGAARLVALAALTFAAAPAASLTASAAPITAAHAGPAARGEPGQQAGELQLMSFSAPAGAAARHGPDVAAARSVTVRPGDCLWSIAARFLGAGDRYREIATMNIGHDMGDGQVFSNPSLIQPGWRLALPATAQSDAPVVTSTGATHHLGHPTKDPHFRRRHATAQHHQAPAAPAVGSSAPVPGSTVPGSTVPGSTVPGSTVSGSSVPAGGVSAVSQPAGQASFQTSADDAAASEHLPEIAVFAAGALAGAVLTSLGRLRRRQRQYRRRGRRIPLPADPQVLAAERKLRAAAPPDGPVSTLPDALRSLETGIVTAGHVLPDIVGLHVTPDVLEVLLAAPALDSPPPPYTITPGRQGMCWQLALPGYGGSEDSGAPGGSGAPVLHGSGLLPGLFTAGGTDAGYLLLDLESLQVTGCDGPPELVDQVVAAAATELTTGQWSGWYDLVLVGFDELSVLGRAEHCATVDDALSLLAERCAVVGDRLADQPPADLRQLRLAAPDDEDWGLTIFVSRVEPTPDQMTHLLELAEDGPGGIAALVAGDPETDDGRMAPTVLQVAPDPQRAGGIVANVIPLQIVVRPQALSEAEYEAISTLFAVAADLDDVSPEQVPYAVYGAPPWLPDAAVLDADDAALPWPDDAEQDAAAGPGSADGDAPRPSWMDGPEPDAHPDQAGASSDLGWHDAAEFARRGWATDPDGHLPQQGARGQWLTAVPADEAGWGAGAGLPAGGGYAEYRGGDAGSFDGGYGGAPAGACDGLESDGYPEPRTGAHPLANGGHHQPPAPDARPPANGFATATPAAGFATPPWVSQPAPPAVTRLEVRILGPFVVTGAVEQLQPKQAELVLALALAAPGGLSNSGLCSMLGADPDHPKPSDAVRQIITRTRRRLGRASDGREYIIHSGNGNYLLHPDAWLDWTEFRRLLSEGRAEDMRAALALVRGEPFTGSFHWWVDIPLMETVRAEIVDAALALGEFELSTGVPRAAARAVRAGLAAETSAEQLWRLLMMAEHAAGNTAGVAEAWRRCLDAIEDVAPGGEPHPETEALYRQLTAVATRQHAPLTG
jgi:DNA-binding SARP family transcriptional activator